MKIEKFRHENVLPDGTFSDKLGAVNTKAMIRQSQPSGGCNLEGCNCSNGHWFMVAKARTEEGVIEGVRFIFPDQAELNKFVTATEGQLLSIDDYFQITETPAAKTESKSLHTKVPSANEYWKRYSNLCQFEEGDPEYLMDKEDFLNFAQQACNTHDELVKENDRLKNAMDVIRFLSFKHEVQHWEDAKGTDKEKLDAILDLAREANWGVNGSNETEEIRETFTSGKKKQA